MFRLALRVRQEGVGRRARHLYILSSIPALDNARPPAPRANECFNLGKAIRRKSSGAEEIRTPDL